VGRRHLQRLYIHDRATGVFNAKENAEFAENTPDHWANLFAGADWCLDRALPEKFGKSFRASLVSARWQVAI